MTVSSSGVDETHGRSTGASTSGLLVKSIDEPGFESDGARILVSQLWPKGVTREQASLTEWRADWAPSRHLCEWFGQLRERWDEFCERYEQELAGRGKLAGLQALARRARSERVTLVFADSDRELNAGTALARIVRGLSR